MQTYLSFFKRADTITMQRTSKLRLSCQFLQRCIHYMQHGLATRKLSVCLSVCPCIKRVDCDKTEDFYTIRKIIYPSFLRRRMVGGGDRFYLKFWVKLTSLEQKRRFLADIRS